jgi:serine O-acetyltransferase
MIADSGAAFRRDLARWVGTTRRPAAWVALKLIAANPGVQAVLLLRSQIALQDANHRRLARAVSSFNLRLTGAEFVVGCKVGPGLVLRHPQGVVIGQGAAVGENCTLLHGVTLGERHGDGSGPLHEYPRLGARVVVGAGAAILGGITVGDDAVVGANAVVLRDVDVADVVVGVPAVSVRLRRNVLTASGSQAMQNDRGQ